MGGVINFGPTTRNNKTVSAGGLSTRAIPPTASGVGSVDSSVPVMSRSNGPMVLSYIPFVSPTPKTYHTDTLTLSENSVINNKYVPIPRNGVSAYRPEIIMLCDYEKPTDKTGYQLTTFGKLLDVEYQSRLLRADTLAGMYSAITGSVALTQDLQNVQFDYTRRLSLIESSLVGQTADFAELAEIAKSFELKTIPDSMFDTSRFMTPKLFFERGMQYQPSLFYVFSETKILQQMLFDFRQSLEGYSLGLFDTTDQDRTEDKNPITLDKTTTRNFTIESFRSTNTPRNILEQKEFSSFIAALPQNPDDRLKLLVHSLSKELRVSKGLAKTIVKRKLTDSFLTTKDGNPFDNMIGLPGDTIFDAPLGAKSLSNLFYVKLDENNFVLPFENKFIDDKQSTFIPGVRYYVDSIVNLTNEGDFNVQPFIDYANKFATSIGDVNLVLRELFEFENSSNSPSAILKNATTAWANLLEGLSNKRTVRIEDAVGVALFRFCSTDKQLRLLLLKFLLLLGAASSDTKPIFTRALSEQNDKTLLPNLSSLQRKISACCEEIETRVFSLLNPDARASVATFGVFAPTNTDPNKISIAVERGVIPRILMLSVGAVGNSIFKEFVNFCNDLDQEAMLNGDEFSYLLEDNSGRTKFNYLSSSYVIAMLYELFGAISKRYVFVDFVKSNQILSFNVEVDVVANQNTKNIFGQFTVHKATPGVRPTPLPVGAKQLGSQTSKTASSALEVMLNNIFDKLEKEETYVLNVMHIMSVLSTRISQASRRASVYFTLQKAKELAPTQVPLGQLKLANYIFTKTPKTGFNNAKVISTNERNLLLALAKETPYKESRVKLLVVGIPAGFIDNLTNRAKRNSINNQTFTKNDFDLFKIVINRKMMEFDDVVFKPQKFLFDMSLFYSQPTGFDISLDSRYSRVLDVVSLLDFSSGTSRVVSKATIIGNQKYDSLSTAEKELLFKNHFESGLLSSYLLLATSLPTTEDVFVLNDQVKTTPNPALDRLVKNYFAVVKNTPIPTTGVVPKELADELNLLSLTSGLFSDKTLDRNILGKKLFDRVFVVPVDMDNFAIDVESTKQTFAGSTSYENTRTQNRIKRVGNQEYISRENENAFVFDDLFVSVETVN